MHKYVVNFSNTLFYSHNILDLTGSTQGIKLLISSSDIMYALFELTNDEFKPIAKNALLCLVNITSDETGADAVMKVKVCYWLFISKI